MFGNVAYASCFFFNYVYVLDPRVHRAEIGLISQGGSNLGGDDISAIFGSGDLPSGGLTVMDRKLKVMASLGGIFIVSNRALEVWTEDIEGDGSLSRA
jgi:hypothetical protein